MHLDIDFVRQQFPAFSQPTLKVKHFLRMQEDHMPASRL